MAIPITHKVAIEFWRVKANMKSKFELIKKLDPFICPHPTLHPEAGEIYTPRKNLVIQFFFEGGFVVEGSGPELEINFNDDDLIILAVQDSVYRFKKPAFVGFKLLQDLTNMDSSEVAGIKCLVH